MSEQEGRQQGRDGVQQRQGSPLKTDRGQTTVQDGVVSEIAGIAAQEVDGVRMGGGSSRSAGGLLGSIPGIGGQGESRGVSVEVGQEETAINLTAAVAYGKSIPQLAEAVRRSVVNRVENLAGVRVTEVNITVSNVFFPQQEQEQRQRRESEQQQRPSRVR